MKFRQLSVILLLGLPLRSLALVPPELPVRRTTQVYSPVAYSLGNLGRSVFLSGGVRAQGYFPDQCVVDVAPDAPSVNPNCGISKLLSMLGQEAGILHLETHSSALSDVQGSVFMVEVYKEDSSKVNRCERADGLLASYISAGLIKADEMERISDSGYCVLRAKPLFVVRRLLASHGIVHGMFCESAQQWPLWIDRHMVRNYISYADQVFTAGFLSAFFYTDGLQRTQLVFENMAGTRDEAGGYGNQSAAAAVAATNNKLVGSGARLFSDSNLPSAASMRLYNAPRIVMSELTEDAAGDSTYSNQVYKFVIGEDRYPYNPGSNTDYPSGGVVQTGVFTNKPLQIRLRFSEPMRRAFFDFHATLQFSDGTSLTIPPFEGDNGWTNVNLPDPGNVDTWTGRVTLPINAPTGRATIKMRAARIVVSPALDLQNQELDTTGSGSAAVGAEDVSTIFTINADKTPPLVSISAGYDILFDRLPGTAITVPTTRSPTARVTVHDDIGLASVVLPVTPTVLYPADANLAALAPGTKDVVAEIAGLAPGNAYSFSAKNSRGNITQGSWRVEKLALVVNTAEAAYDQAADHFSGTINIRADSTALTEKIIQFDPTTQNKIADHAVGPFNITVPANRPNTTVLDFFSSRDVEGNSSIQSLEVYEGVYSFESGPGIVDRALRVVGNGSVSAALPFPDNPAPAQAGTMKPGVIRVEAGDPAGVGFNVGRVESNIPVPILDNPPAITFSLSADGQVLVSGTMSSDFWGNISGLTIPAAIIPVTGTVNFTATIVAAQGVSSGACLEASGSTCLRPLLPMISASPPVRTLNYFMPLPQLGPHIPIYEGAGQTVSLGNGATLSGFNATSSGLLSKAAFTSAFVEEGSVNLLGDRIYLIEASSTTDAAPFYTPSFTLKLTFDPTKRTPGKDVKLARMDPCRLTMFDANAPAGGNTATAEVTGFGRYAIVESKYTSAYQADYGRCHFVSGESGVSADPSTVSAEFNQAINVLGSLGLKPIGTTCKLGPTAKQFSPPGELKICYDPADLTQAGVSDALSIYQFNESGVRELLAGMYVDRTRGFVTGNVSRFSSQFGAFAATTSVPASDLLPPITTLAMDGQALPGGTSFFMTTTSTLSLQAADATFPGAPVSGVAGTFILLDAPFVDTVSTPGQPYAGPFSLGIGSHTLAYYSVDLAGNIENPHIVSVLANPPPSRGVAGLAVGRDSTNRLWTVALDNDAVTLARTDANGVMVASAPLPQALSDGRWNLFFDETGGVYAVGAAEGPSTQASDVAVYKASPDGDALASSGYFDGGFGAGDFVFDAAAPGWIAGAVEISEGVLKSALWRFNPANGTVSLSTAFASGAAMGVAVDADGSVWAAGYVRNPSPRSSRVYDLGLWHFASDGQTLLAGPYKREAYAADFSPTSATKIFISSGAVTVVAPRGRPGGGTDLGAVRFDKSSGAATAESAWRAADGSAAYPAAALPEGEGILAAGGLEAGATRAALWRFGADGSLAAATLAAAGGARGASAAGADLWLAVDDATAPYKVTSESALAGALSDVRPPRVELAVGTPTFVNGGGSVFAAPASYLNFTAADDKLAFGDGLGAGAPSVYYRADSTGAFAAYSGPFSLAAEGAHDIEFYGVDAADNPGPILSRPIAVDATAPVTQASQNGADITLAASDPGGAGVSRIRYLVDYSNPDVCNNVAEDTAAARGTCENPWYAGPFTLSNGPHTLYFQAFDAVGNAEVLRTTYPFVEAPGSGPSAGGMGIGKDAFDALWTVVLDSGALAFAHSNSSGTLISSSTLQDAAAGFPWSVFFGPDGRAYAVGGAAGPATQALDLAVYKASLGGDAIESRTLFDSGYANNDIVFDAKAPGWIVGAVQTSGPTDIEAAGGDFSMALWRFDPALGTVQLKTTYARAGFDLGAGLAVDADGSLWIAGYSLSAAAPAVGGIDLALWHYAANGQTLLGGPFLRPGYLDNLDSDLTARVFVSSQAVYVAAPRANNSGGTDMAFLRYDKTSGLPTSEVAWRPADGTPSYPIAMLPEASGLLVAGGIGGNFTEAGLWRFGFNGALQSVTTTDAGGAMGAVFRGSELWLAVDGSTVPYRVDAEVAVPGALVDLAPPRTSLAAGTPSFTEAQTVYVTSATSLGFAVADDYLVSGDGLGVGATQTFYAEASVAYSRFTSSFTLVAEGTHTVSFFSVDLEGRVEAVKTQSVGVDLTAPVATLVSSGSLFSIAAIDPVVGGAASGVGQIQYLVDHDPECNVAQSTAAPPGTCENLAYAGPFELAPGTHTVYFAAVDRVGNGSEVTYSSFVTVVASSFLALSADGAATIVSARADETITPVSLGSFAAAAAAAGGQGLVLMTPSVYELAPSPVVFDPPALLSIRFDPSVVSTAAVALYRFDGALWSSAPVTGQQVSVLSSTSAVASGFLGGASLYGVFSTQAPPLTVSSVDPSSGTNVGSVGVTVTGTGFAPGDALKLSRLSPTANTWATVGFNIYARSRFPAVTLPNGKVLVEGGEGPLSNQNVTGAELFDPSAGTWSVTSPLPSPRRFHTATLLNNGKVLVAGGVSGETTGILYDPSAGTWSASGTMSSGHTYHTATLMPNGKVLIAGGFNAGATAICAVYDPETGTFSATQSLSAARYRHTASLLPDGRVLVVGGLQGSTALASTEIYDPSAGTWSPGAPMSINRDNHTATLLPNGKVLVAGGTANETSPRSSAEVYDPGANVWITVGSMASARGFHTATLLSNGLVLVTGGFGSGILSSAELFDAAVGAWSAAPSMATARGTHAAAMLSDGRVLITGGQDANGKVRVTEVYRPLSTVEVSATGVSALDSTRLAGTFDLTNRPLGSWNVVVTDVGGSSAALNGAFTILAVTPPTAVGNLALSVVNPSSVTLRWTAPSAAGVAVTSYDLRVATFAITTSNFASATPVAAPAPAAPGVTQTAVVTNAAGTSFFAALISRDAANTSSVLSNVPSLQRSATMINGVAELSAWAGIPLSLSQVSTASPSGGAALAAAESQGLMRVSSLYALGPQGAFFSPSGTLSFRYSTATLTASGFTAADVRVYQYVNGAMTVLSTQTLNANAQLFTATVSSPPALFGLFGFVAPPVAATIVPNSGTNTGSIGVSLSGSGLRVSDTLKLSRASAAANTWSVAGAMLTGRSRFPAVTLPNGKVLVEGGEGWPNPNILAAELFNPSSGTWSMTTAMPDSRRYHTATLLPNGKVLVVGGVGAETTALLYNPTAGTWASAGTMAASHYYHTATLLPSGRVLIAGGHIVGGGTAACEIYDPVAGTFAATQPMAGARYQHTASLLPDGRVMVAGGFHDNTSDSLSSVEIYDPSAGTWTPGASMSSGRGFHASTLLDDGTVLVEGGIDDLSLFASAEIYNPSTDTWTGVGAMSAGRSLHTATRLPDGRVLVAGGSGGGGVLNTAEIFDPGTGAWSAAPPLFVARAAHTAVPLPDGRILLAGGQNVNSPLASSEIYTPTSPADIVATGIASANPSLLTGLFNLTGQPTGTWDVVVADTFGRSSTLRGGFTVNEAARPAAVADLSIAVGVASSLTLSWTAPASAVPLASYDLRRASFPITSANFASASPLAAPSPAAPGVVQSVIVENVTEDSFFVALKSLDSSGGVSALSNVPSMVRSAVAVDGRPELTFSANVSVTATMLSTIAAPGTVVLATATAQGLTLASSIYDLGPEGAVFSPSAKLTFAFSTTALASLGLSPGDIMIYQYVPGVGMVAVSSQTVDTAANTITGYVPSLSSIFAVFGVVKDRAAPVTSLTRGSSATFADASGNLYVSPAASFGFSAYDPAIFGIASGVERTNYRVDGASTAPFVLYTSTFSLSAEGQRTLWFYSEDHAGNVEVVRSSGILVDASAPVTTLQVIGSSVADVSGGLIVSSTTAIALSAADPVSNGVASGVGGIFYAQDADPAAPYAGPFALPPGVHSLSYFSKDNVANVETANVLSVLVDTVAPRSVLLVDGIPATGPGVIIVSTNSLGFSASDAGAGIAQILYSLDGAAEQVFISTFSPSAGNHTLAYRGVDLLGNAEAAHQVALNVLLYDVTPPSVALSIVDRSTITTAAPFIAATYGDDGRGVDVSSVRLTLDGADVTAQAAVTASSATFTPALSQGSHDISISFADFAGNHAFAAASFFVDSLPPVTILQVNGVAASTTALVIVSTDSLGFASLDAGTGVAQTVYSLDGGAPTVYVSTFSLAAGAHTLAYHSVDRAGNVEPAVNAAVSILLYDIAPPSLVLTPASGSTVTTAAPLIAAVYSDSGRGIDVSSVKIFLDGVDATAQAVVTASSAVFIPGAVLSQGGHTVTAEVADLAGNRSSGAATFLLDSVAPVTTLLVNGLATNATSLVLISTDSIGFSALDAGVGTSETRYALDGSTSEVVYVSPFNLSAGAHILAFYSRDFAGNVEPVRTASIGVLAEDVAPPSLALSPISGSTITTTTPVISASYSDLGRGVDLASIRISLDGQEAGASVGASSASFTPGAALSQGTHTVTAAVSDLAGNAAFALATFHIDSLPPMTTLLVNGLAAGSANLVLASTDAVSFAAADSGVGVLETRYSVNGASETIFTTPFFLSPGNGALAFHSRDRAGNQEAIRTVSVTVTAPSSDTDAPLMRLDLPAVSALGVEQALGGVVDVRGMISDASAVAWTLESAQGAAAVGGFTTIASGAGNLSGHIAAWNTAALSGYQTVRLRATDAFGNSSSATATVFIGGPVFTFAVGRKDSHVIVNTLKGPTGIAVRSDGAVWVASTENDKILLLSPAGVLLGEAGHAPGRSGEDKARGKKDKDDEGEGAGGVNFKTPQGLALDAADNLYVADRDLNRVVKLSPDGRVLLLQLGKAGSGNGELRHPFDVAVDGNGDVYVADSGNRRIQVFNSAGGYVRQFGAGVLLSTSEVRGIALTAEGLWVSDKEFEVIHLFSRSGALVKTIGGADSAVGELSRMRGLASDRLGSLYVVEPNRDRIQKFDPRGKGLLAFGSKAGLSQADKVAKRYLTQPIDAAVAPDGSIWIADTGRDRIVRYALPASGSYAAAAYAAGGEFSSSSVEPARRVVDHKDGAKVERDDGAGVSVPRGALAADLEITVEKGDENQDKEQKEAKRRDMKISAVSEEVQYGPEGTTFAAPVTLILPYDANLIASRGIKEDDLKVYYWNPTLKDWQAMPSTVDKLSKTVHAQTTHFSAYQVGGMGGIGVAAVDDFGLRDGYAFPNPSRNGSAVTFRMQPGSVDSIEVRVYDLSGRKVHSSSDFRFQGAIDDGNGKGLQNTYDHVWNVSGVGSGVYTFVMTARKAGQSDIRKTGKIGVIK